MERNWRPSLARLLFWTQLAHSSAHVNSEASASVQWPLSFDKRNTSERTHIWDREAMSLKHSLQSEVLEMARVVADHHRSLQDEDLGGAISLQPVCDSIQQNFNKPVNCVCTGSSVSSFSISCEFSTQVCSPLGTVCGRPFIGMSISGFNLFSVTACVYDYTRRNASLNDTCISMEVCPNSEAQDLSDVSFCSCTAQYGTKICSACSVCDGGHGISMDCSSFNAEVVTPSCKSPDMDLDLGGVTSSVVGFVPNLNGLCSRLESSLNNRIDCDCSDSGGGTFDITCKSGGSLCNEAGVCGSTKSSISFSSGSMTSITSCADYDLPVDLEQTCVTFGLEPDKHRLSNCTATYGGNLCKECSICFLETAENQNATGVMLDCSNREPWAVLTTCQATESPVKTLEYVPQFDNVRAAPSTSSSNSMYRLPWTWPVRLLLLVVGGL